MCVCVCVFWRRNIEAFGCGCFHIIQFQITKWTKWWQKFSIILLCASSYYLAENVKIPHMYKYIWDKIHWFERSFRWLCSMCVCVRVSSVYFNVAFFRLLSYKQILSTHHATQFSHSLILFYTHLVFCLQASTYKHTYAIHSYSLPLSLYLMFTEMI